MNTPFSRRRVFRGLLRVILPVLLAGFALLVLAGVAAASEPRDLPDAVVYNPLVADVISLVTTPTLRYEMEGLTGERPVAVAGISYTIETRNTLDVEAISMTTRYVYEWLAATGLDVSYHTYTWGDYTGRNVVAEKRGVVDPDKVYLITAHLDDMPPDSRAPGADDNASGSVAVMMAARLLASRDLAYTVRFILFTGEEYGLFGSDAYAADCAARGEAILGVINLDMIGYNTGKPVYDVFALPGDDAGAPESRRLAAILVEVVDRYDLDLVTQRITIEDYPLVGGSDQWSFLEKGYPAILVSEGFAAGDFNPYYHQVDDTVSVIDWDYFATLTRASIATLAHVGHILPGGDVGRISGTVYNSYTSRTVPYAAVTAFWPAYYYTFTAKADGAGEYGMVLPAGAYTLTVSGYPLPYTPTVIADVAVTADGLVAQDVALTPTEEPISGEMLALPLDPILNLVDPARTLVLLIISWRVIVSDLGW